MLNLTPYCFSNNHRQKLTCILGSFDKRKNWELITIRANFCQGKHVYLLFICFEDFCTGFVSFLRGHPSQIGANNLFEVLKSTCVVPWVHKRFWYPQMLMMLKFYTSSKS